MPDGLCPRCEAVPLEPLSVGSLPALACEHCAGLWLHTSAVERIRRMRDASEPEALAQRAFRQARSPAREHLQAAACPFCGCALAAQSLWSERLLSCAEHGGWADASQLIALGVVDDAPLNLPVPSLHADATGVEDARGWWSRKRNPMLLAITALVTIGALVPLGWFTSFRTAALGLVGSAMTLVFLPVVLIGAGIFLVVGLGIIGAIVSEGATIEGGVHLIAGGVKLFPRFLRWFGKVRHPVFLGLLLGLATSGALLGGMILATAESQPPPPVPIRVTAPEPPREVVRPAALRQARDGGLRKGLVDRAIHKVDAWLRRKLGLVDGGTPP